MTAVHALSQLSSSVNSCKQTDALSVYKLRWSQWVDRHQISDIEDQRTDISKHHQSTKIACTAFQQRTNCTDILVTNLFHFHQIQQEALVVGKLLELSQLFQVSDPLVSDFLPHPNQT